MKCRLLVHSIIFSVAISASALAAAPADRGKRRIEKPLEQLIAVDKVPAAADERPAAAIGDVTKRAMIEFPVEKLVVANTLPEDDNPSGDNPRVEPGKVQWHDDFAAACKAAGDSGKPVLLFHLMGQLDQKFT